MAPIDDILPRAGLKTLRISSFTIAVLAEGLSKAIPLLGLKHLQLVEYDAVVGFIQTLSQLEVVLVSYYADFGRTHSNIKRPNEELLKLMTTPKRLIMSSQSAAPSSGNKSVISPSLPLVQQVCCPSVSMMMMTTLPIQVHPGSHPKRYISSTISAALLPDWSNSLCPVHPSRKIVRTISVALTTFLCVHTYRQNYPAES